MRVFEECQKAHFSLAWLELRLGAEGLGFRFFPFQIFWKKVGWEQIRQARVVDFEAVPPGPTGWPRRDWTRRFYLLKRTEKALAVELVNGETLFFSLEGGEAARLFLQNGAVFWLRA